MSKIEHYHFHRDCIYYDEKNVNRIKEGKHEYITFYCPKTGQKSRYYVGDFQTIKWECGSFEPKQPTLFDKGMEKEPQEAAGRA